MRSSIFRVFSSWWTTAGLLLASAAAYFVFLPRTSPYADWTAFLFHNPAGLLLYCALMLNICLASVRIVAEKRSCPDVALSALQSMDAYSALPSNGPDSISTITASLKQKGYAISRVGTSVCATKNRYSFLPGTILRAGIIILMASALLSVHARKSHDVILHEGDTISSEDSQLKLASIASDMPETFLHIGEESSFRLYRVQAVLQSPSAKKTITAGFPVLIGGRYYRITHFGYRVPVMITGRAGTLRTALDLDVLPPGASDAAEFQSHGLMATFSLLPERTITKGLLKGKEYNLRNPSFHIVLQHGSEKEKIGELSMAEEGSAALPFLSLSLGRHAFYVKVRAVSDPALPFLYAGSLLTLSGLLLMLCRFFWYKKELAAVHEDGILHIGYREEFFKKWGIQKFHSWTFDLSGAAGGDDTLNRTP